MSKSPNIALGLQGTLWNIPVSVQLIHRQDFDQGTIRFDQDLDLTQVISEVLNVETEPSSIVIPTSQGEINFFLKQEDSKNYYAIDTQLGGLNFQYSKGENAHSFFIKIQLASLLSTIPGFNSELVSGHLYFGITKGKAYQFIPDKNGLFSAKEIAEGFQFGGQISIHDQPLSIGIANEDSTEKTLPQDSSPKTDNGQKPSNPTANSNGIHWIDLNKKSLGPILLHSLGFQLKGKKALLLINADFSLGGFTISFLGLGTQVDILKLTKKPLEAFEFKLLGLGLAFETPGLSIAGMFMKTHPQREEYAGGVMVKTKAFAITGFGAYGKMDGYTSLFGYLSLKANIGGDPAFFITGISICFGYNRQIIIPPISEIHKFPLVKHALDTNSTPSFKGKNPLVEFSLQLGKFMPPKEGNFFFGIGVRFSTYKLVDSVALLILSIGDDLEFTLLGLSRLVLPPGANKSPIVFIEIALKATYSVNKGVLQIEGRLTNQSYIFSQQLTLTGGFAFYAWFKDHETAKAGDFVISVGGYHPLFKKPAHYPTVPRVGFEWKVGTALSITGKMYMALTPLAIMAGGEFHAIWNKGGLYAEFKFGVDFLIQWKPFYYDAHIYVNLRVEFKVKKWGISKSVSLGISADLHIWGPDFSGTAKLKIKVLGIGFSFSIAFGNASGEPDKLEWQEFKSSFLPPELTKAPQPKIGKSNILTPTLVNGLIEEKESEETTIWIVNPKEFELNVGSIIPVTTIVNQTKTSSTEIDAYYIPISKVGKVSSELHYSVRHNGKELDPERIEKIFQASLISKNMPKAIWNTKDKNDPLSSDSTSPMTVGISLKASKDAEEGNSKLVHPEVFDFDQTENERDCSQTPNKQKNSEINFHDFFIMDSNTYSTKDFIQLAQTDVKGHEE
jgi:hypothetical protein